MSEARGWTFVCVLALLTLGLSGIAQSSDDPPPLDDSSSLHQASIFREDPPECPHCDPNVVRASTTTSVRPDEGADGYGRLPYAKTLTHNRGPNTKARARLPRATPLAPRDTNSADSEIQQAQVPAQPTIPRPSLPRTSPSGSRSSTSSSSTNLPRARPLPSPTPPATSQPSASAAPVAAAPRAEMGSIANEAFARAPAANLASEGTGSGAADIGFNYTPVMLGDQAPASLHQLLVSTRPPVPQPAVPGRPPTPPVPPRGHAKVGSFAPWARGFKISDNQSPMPQDRFFYTFDYFNQLNYAVNRAIGSPISDMEAYRQLLGIEKTFWQGDASIGLRVPINTLWTNSIDGALKNNSTSLGNMTVFSKFVLWRSLVTGSLVSGGLAVTTPNGPTAFAGSPNVVGFRDVQFQPFLGYLVRRKDWYLQGFTAIDVPTDTHDVTMWYNDVAVGYYAYRSADPRAWLTAIVPTFEVHLSDPLNHRGAFRPNDPAGTPDVVDLTLGSSFVLGKRVVASFCAAAPVTGPRPFNVEAMALLNIYYGRMGPSQASSPPPMAGQ